MAPWDLGNQLGAGYQEASQANLGAASLAERIRSSGVEEGLKQQEVNLGQGKLDYERELGNASAVEKTGYSLDDLNNPDSGGVAALRSRIADTSGANLADVASQTKLRNAQADYFEGRNAATTARWSPANRDPQLMSQRLTALEKLRSMDPTGAQGIYRPEDQSEYQGITDAYNSKNKIAPGMTPAPAAPTSRLQALKMAIMGVPGPTAPQSGPMRVQRISDGKPGTIDPKDFDPGVYKQIQ